MEKTDSTILTIWDSEGKPPPDIGQILLWRGFCSPGESATVSITELVEQDEDAFRASYLSWVYELGETIINGQKLVEHLEIRSNFSYWWMTLLVEKCNFAKSPQIDDAVKVLALEGLLNQSQVEQIELVTANLVLLEVLQDWCDKNGVNLKCTQLAQSKSKKYSFKGIFKRIPNRIQAFVWLFHRLVTHWHLAGVGVAQWRQSRANTSFVSYFDNLVPEAAEQGKFESRYWGNLSDSLARDVLSTRWLHIWVKDKVAPSAKVAKKLVERFNRAIDNKQVHVTLDSFLGLQTVWNTLVAWLGLQWKARKIESELSKPSGAAFNLWPLLRDDWIDSIKGPTSMSNLLMLNLFEAAFAEIPEQKQGCYLQENQGWEFGFIAAWNHTKHTGLIGVLHSTVRFWDLRYFFDDRSYQRTGMHNLPLPSKVAVNGPVAKNLYLEGGYPSDQIVEVEALRYLHLANPVRKILNTSPSSEPPQRLLVLGDYLPVNTQQQMELLEKVAQQLARWKIVIKPHPNCPVTLELYPQLKALGATTTDEVISKIFVDYNVAYTSSVTSAAVDAYCAGLQVISVLDPVSLNLGPLRGIPGVNYIGSSDDLYDALVSADQRSDDRKPLPEYFTVDEDLLRWKKLLLS